MRASIVKRKTFHYHYLPWEIFLKQSFQLIDWLIHSFEKLEWTSWCSWNCAYFSLRPYNFKGYQFWSSDSLLLSVENRFRKPNIGSCTKYMFKISRSSYIQMANWKLLQDIIQDLIQSWNINIYTTYTTNITWTILEFTIILNTIFTWLHWYWQQTRQHMHLVPVILFQTDYLATNSKHFSATLFLRPEFEHFVVPSWSVPNLRSV